MVFPKGKTTHNNSTRVELDATTISPNISELFQFVTICFYSMFVKKIPFAVSISIRLKLATAKLFSNHEDVTIISIINSIKKEYSQKYFIVNHPYSENKFQSICQDQYKIFIITKGVSRFKHVPQIELHIRTLKKRCRGTYSMIPFKKRWYMHLFIELIFIINLCMTNFLASGRILSNLNPREIIIGVKLVHGKNCVVPFGDYVHTCEEHDKSLSPCTIGSIYLHPTVNGKLGPYFLRLYIYLCINFSHWVEIPMPNDTIDWVYHL